MRSPGLTWLQIVFRDCALGRVRLPAIRIVVLALYVLASTLFGFAHSGSVYASAANPNSLSTAYMLPDGSYPDICGGTGKTGDMPSVCDACMLASTTMGAEAPATAAVPTEYVVASFEPRDIASPFRAAIIDLKSRGPPFLT